MMAFSASLSIDRRLAADDVRGSVAHVHGPRAGGRSCQADEVETLEAAPRRVGAELEADSFDSSRPTRTSTPRSSARHRARRADGRQGAHRPQPERPGRHGASAVHPGGPRVIAEVLELSRTLERRATEAGDAYLPGYTHLQRAQPVAARAPSARARVGARRDARPVLRRHRRSTSRHSARERSAGSTLALDPEGWPKSLGSRRRFENSLDAVSDRDFVAEALFDLALLACTSRGSARRSCLFSSEEFGFYRLDDAWATGSSMLPQKKNPDIAELARGKAGRLVGHLAGFLTTLKGLPLAYNRDLQEDKEPLFDALDQVAPALPRSGG